MFVQSIMSRGYMTGKEVFELGKNIFFCHDFLIPEFISIIITQICECAHSLLTGVQIQYKTRSK